MKKLPAKLISFTTAVAMLLVSSTAQVLRTLMLTEASQYASTTDLP